MAPAPTRSIHVYSDGSYRVLTNLPLPVQYYMQKEDKDVWGSLRGCVPCPAVWVLKSDPHAYLNKQWQYYLWAINYNMEMLKVRRLLDPMLAFANFTGLGASDDPRADYFLNKDLGEKLPNLDKVRTTSRSVMTGTEQFSLVQGIREAVSLLGQMVKRQQSFLGAKTTFRSVLARSENVLKVKVFDSRQDPPLKPGYSYPSEIKYIDPSAYEFLPETHPEMFLVANIVNREGEVVQFPFGGLYPWIDGGKTPYSFMPHIANLGYGDILYPLRYLYKVPLGAARPRAYRLNE